MVFILGRDPDNTERIVLCCVKANARTDPPALEFRSEVWRFVDDDGVPGTAPLLTRGGECQFDARHLLTLPADNAPRGRPPDKRDAAAAWLTRYLRLAPNHEARASEVEEDAKHHAISTKTLTRATHDLAIIKTQRNHAWWWRLPPQLIRAAHDTDPAH